MALNTYVFDPEHATELARLINQDRAITQAMGGPLSGITDPSTLHNVLDLACGPGGWVLDMAFYLPDAEIEGVDVSRTVVDYANARARTQRLINASFGVMDITQPLDFPDHAFDLVNARFLAAVLKREVWPLLLDECTRVLRSGGLLHLTEAADFGTTNSEAINQLMDLIMCALYQLGYGFSHDHSLNLLPTLLSFLQQQEYQHIQVTKFSIDYSAKTNIWADMYHNIEIICYQMKPLLLGLDLIDEKRFDVLYQKALIDMYTDAFYGMGHITTIAGRKP
jgi:ubiquinone/menaquinone biosynthesis C-methylase UbiE